MKTVGARPKPEDFPLDTEYAAAYMAWRKKDADARKDQECHTLYMKINTSQPVIKQEPMPQVASGAENVKHASEGLRHSSTYSPVPKVDHHVDGLTETTTTTKIKREREYGSSSPEPLPKRNSHREGVIHAATSQHLHTQSMGDLTLAMEKRSTRMGKAVAKIKQAEQERETARTRRQKEEKLIDEAEMRRSREDKLVLEATERWRTEQSRFDKASKQISKENNRMVNLSRKIVEVLEEIERRK